MKCLQFDEVRKQIDDNFTFGSMSFESEAGTITAIVGSNGSGKTASFR
ncbi:hypothetical protein [Halalkalibacterium ligniniphilum]|nr:hypothetical protein [Halalkalibacterium ligniniphilum]